MKNQEQVKQEVISYLTKTSKHTFVKPNKDGSFTYFKVFKTDDDQFKVLESNSSFGYKIRAIDVDYYLQTYKGNAKCVISNTLFLNKKMKSIKNNKFVKSQIEDLLKVNVVQLMK